MKKPLYGYCAVTADFLHIGHIKFMKFCKSKCESLIVGVMTDECVKEYKGKKPIMSFDQRKEIIQSLNFVHRVQGQETFDFPHHVLRLKTHYGKDFIIFDSEDHSRDNADVLVPYTKSISSTIFKERLCDCS